MDGIIQFLSDHSLRVLDILGAVVGLVYIILEYRASIYLWLASIIMPLIDMWLYLKAGLYADFGMAIYYALAAIYGYVMWRWIARRDKDIIVKDEHARGISHIPLKRVKYVFVAFSFIWLAIYLILHNLTDSTVPVTDSFVNALSIVALWALSRKYVEQWLLWMVVDIFCCALYTYKNIPFKAGIYGLYVVIAVLGYRKWLFMMKSAR